MVHCCHCMTWNSSLETGPVVVAWHSGSTLVSINEVTLCRAWLVTGMGDRLRVGKAPRFVTSHSGQLSLLPSAGWKMSTGQNAVMLCSWGVKVGMVHSACRQMCGWQVNCVIPR